MLKRDGTADELLKVTAYVAGASGLAPGVVHSQPDGPLNRSRRD